MLLDEVSLAYMMNSEKSNMPVFDALLPHSTDSFRAYTSRCLLALDCDISEFLETKYFSSALQLIFPTLQSRRIHEYRSPYP